ncbi:MAG: oligosaccharide flippase family protein, partial [Gammaproteobacteria bacterium]
YLATKLDYLVIGRVLGAEVLGAYMLAYRLVVMPLNSLNPLLAQVAFPILARKQADNAALARGYLEMIKIIAFVSLPILVGIGTTAPLVVEVLFGEKWATVAPLLQIMVMVGMLGALTQPVGPLVLAKGRPDVAFKWALATAILNGCVFWYAAHYGVYALALSYVGLIAAYFVARATLIVKPLIQLPVARQMAVLLRPAAVGVLLGVAMFVAQSGLADVSVSNRTLLLALAAFGIVVYGSLMLIFDRRYLVDSWYLLVNKNTRA